MEVKLPLLEPQPQMVTQKLEVPKAEPQIVEVANEESVREVPEKVEEPVVVKPLKPKSTPKPFLLNIGAALDDTPQKQATTTDEEASVVRVVDPQSEKLLNVAKERIVKYIGDSRPRFRAFFEEMKITGNSINIEVSTETLSTEIRRVETEILTDLIRIAGINGVVELSVEIHEEIKAKRPIKLEDRVAYFAQLNPMIAELTKALDMQVDG